MEYLVPGIMAALAVIMAAVSVKWALFIRSARVSARHLPALGGGGGGGGSYPRVSVILPARDEEDYIGLCLRTLVRQDYPDFEIIVIDDNSTDATYDIVRSFTTGDGPEIKVVRMVDHDSAWVGKTLACTRGREAATGDLLLFTDADTEHGPGTMRLAVEHLMSEGADVLTLTTGLRMPEFWTRVTTPVITSFRLAYPDGIVNFSAKRVNDDSREGGMLIGAYFLVKSGAYDAVGGHGSVKNMILEDWMLGKRLKRAGHVVRIADGSRMVDAVWARDLPTLDRVFTRLMSPLVLNKKAKAYGNWLELMLLLSGPHAGVVAAALALVPGAYGGVPDPYGVILHVALAGSALAAVALHAGSYVLQSRYLGIPLRYTGLSWLGGLVATVGFARGLRGRTEWHGRGYGKEMADDGDDA